MANYKHIGAGRAGGPLPAAIVNQRHLDGTHGMTRPTCHHVAKNRYKLTLDCIQPCH